MANDIQIFKSDEFGSVRTLTIGGEPWFVGKDVAETLGYTDYAHAILDHVDEDDRVNSKTQGQNAPELGQRGGWLINESGLYSLILSSKLPKAKAFKRWVTSEVLPSIRKTGGYTVPKTFSEALIAYAKEVEAREKLELENSIMKPKADFYDDVTGSSDVIDIGSVAKVLNMGIGRNKLFQFLRDKGVLTHKNAPYQKYIDAGYFRQVESEWEHDGTTHITLKTVVFQKGVDYIRKILKEAEA